MFRYSRASSRRFSSKLRLTAESRKQKANNNSAAFGLVALGSLAGVVTVGSVAHLSGDSILHPAKYPWNHTGFLDSYDHASIRRGHQVYTQICAACHSLKYVAYRTLVGVAFTEEEVKNMAAEIDVIDGPDETGEMFERPGRLSDRLPSPYKNEEEGRMANNGAYPPDLSLMVKARHGGVDYLFALLTGYRDPPEGVHLREGLHYNPYFPGGAIAMPKQLEDGGVEYEDGTPATETQMAKDVVTFLAWAAEPEHDERKRMGLKFMTGMLIVVGLTFWYKRHRWSVLKARKISYIN